ncbi:MAG: hypothetical protein ABI539_13885, partial [Acidobacteriota bacterium]
MSSESSKRILAERTAENFIGRSSEIERLMRRSTLSEGLLLATPPGAGASELLKQTFDRLFFEKAGSVPFYFELRRRDLTASNAARRFVHEFIVQAVAFRRRDPGIILISPGLSELSELAAPEDGHWIDRLVDYIRSDAPTDDERSFVRNCLTAPARAAARRGFDLLGS